MASTNQTASTASVQPPANMSHGNASEIAWKFVMQYYKYLNKEPEKLHCFYNKTSSLVHGTEAEEATPCFGQQEIHSRLMALGFQDCKVFVHNLDSQSSAGGGIIIQVIGELQNGPDAANDNWRKFTQTFFLAEQTNGYYVLNDIFRYIREETGATDIEESNVDAPAGITVAAAAVPETNGVAEVEEKEAAGSAAWEPVKVNGVHPSQSQKEPEPQPVPAPVPAAPAAQEEAAPIIAEAEPSEPAAQEPTPAPASSAAPESSAPASAPAPSAKSSAPSATASAPQSSAPPQQAPAKPADPPKPAKPNSWASLAGSGAGKWGNNMAESRGISSAAVAGPNSSSSSSAPVSNGAAPAAAAAQAPAPQASGRQIPGPYDVSGITSPSTFIKGVVETVSDEALKETLESAFGPTTEISIVRSKACAFVEFRDISAAKKAVETSHLRGGIVVQGISEQRRKVYIEEKKEKGTAGRGGRTDPANRDNQGYKGAAQGRGAEGDRAARGRGGAPARGRGAAPGRSGAAAAAAK